MIVIFVFFGGGEGEDYIISNERLLLVQTKDSGPEYLESTRFNCIIKLKPIVTRLAQTLAETQVRNKNQFS